MVAGFPTLLLLGVLLALGAVLAGADFYRALRGRRLGGAPFCRRCDYNLTGVAASQCPECGAALSDPRAIVRGERVRSNGRAITSGIILALLLGVLIAGGLGVFQRASLTRYKPAWWLLADVQSGNGVLETKALDELSRRVNAGELSSRSSDVLIELCLTQQTAAKGAGYGPWGQALGALVAAGRLSEPQQARMFQNAVHTELSTRALTSAAGPLIVLAKFEPRGPDRVFMTRVRCVGLAIDSAELDLGAYPESTDLRPDVVSDYMGWGGSGSLETSLPIALPAGSHKLSATFEYAIHRTAVAGMMQIRMATTDDRRAPLLALRKTVETTFEVAPAGEPVVKLVSTPELDKAVTQCVQLSGAFYRETEDGAELTTRFTMRPLPPVGLCFEALAVIDGQEFDAGRIVAPPKHVGGEQPYETRSTARMPRTDAATITLILRASSNVAGQVMWLDEIWDGELRFENVPVVRSAASSPAAAP